MKDSDCIQFLQWALPCLHMRWQGFRKVRAQVCKRVARRMRRLNIDGMVDYCAYLETHPQEWQQLDALTHVTISRFYRDRAVFAFLESRVLPVLAKQAVDRRRDVLRVWSAGCCAGEEPYTVALLWQLKLQPLFPRLGLEVIATDADSAIINRAESACYSRSSIKDLPAGWRDAAFMGRNGLFCLKPEHRRGVRVIEQDVRMALPLGTFDLVLCRNLAFTYHEVEQQRRLLVRIHKLIKTGGVLVIGIHEDLPEGASEFRAWSEKLRVFRKEEAVPGSQLPPPD